MTAEKPNGFRISKEISPIGVAHLFLMIVFLVGLYFRFTAMESAVGSITSTSTRIEHYLSSKDSNAAIIYPPLARTPATPIDSQGRSVPLRRQRLGSVVAHRIQVPAFNIGALPAPWAALFLPNPAGSKLFTAGHTNSRLRFQYVRIGFILQCVTPT